MNSSFEVVFVVDQQYENALGAYTVLSINEPKMKIRYDKAFSTYVRVGQEAIYDIKGQADSISKMMREKAAPSVKRMAKRLKNVPKIGSHMGAFTYGYLAKHGYISIDVGPSSIDTFPDDFKLVTGLGIHQFAGHGYHEDPCMNKYSYSMTITIPNPDEETAKHLSLPVCKLVRDNTIEINSNDYIWELFKNGFLPGSNVANELRIREMMFPEMKDSFKQGFAV